jgi:membrane-associated protease RseP (regulator of RpoE activity)
VRTIDVTPEVQQRNNLPDTAGALVNSVTPGSSAHRAGIPVGAVITALDGQRINSPLELAAAVRGATGGEVELTFIVDGQESKKRLPLSIAAADTPPAPPRRLRAPISSEARRPPAPTIARPEAPDPRIEALEARIRELEQRVESLEAAAARESK